MAEKSLTSPDFSVAAPANKLEKVGPGHSIVTLIPLAIFSVRKLSKYPLRKKSKGYYFIGISIYYRVPNNRPLGKFHKRCFYMSRKIRDENPILTQLYRKWDSLLSSFFKGMFALITLLMPFLR